jgi:hypothetical protein
VNRQSRLRHPFALVAQGFLAAALVFVVADPTVTGSASTGNDAQAAALLAELTR